jgi:hypothetical protein
MHTMDAKGPRFHQPLFPFQPAIHIMQLSTSSLASALCVAVVSTGASQTASKARAFGWVVWSRWAF